MDAALESAAGSTSDGMSAWKKVVMREGSPIPSGPIRNVHVNTSSDGNVCAVTPSNGGVFSLRAEEITRPFQLSPGVQDPNHTETFWIHKLDSTYRPEGVTLPPDFWIWERAKIEMRPLIWAAEVRRASPATTDRPNLKETQAL